MTPLEIAPVWRPEIQQRVFRRVLEAAARPGTIVDLPEAESATADLAVLAMFVDGSVSAADLDGRLDAAAWRFLGARREAPNAADFILADGGKAPPESLSPKLGTLEGPDKGATIILAVARLGDGRLTLALEGPGVASRLIVAASGLDTTWLMAREGWSRSFPLGVDFILADASRALALPRTTRVELI